VLHGCIKVNEGWVVTSMGETQVVGSQEFSTFPCDFVFGVIIPLDLIEPSSLVMCDSVLLVDNLGGVCLVCQIQFQWDGVFDNNISRRLQTSFKLGDMKHIMNPR
jgi:hypothetical protein